MAQFKVDAVELSGSLIKSGRLEEALPMFLKEVDEAHSYGFITHHELVSLFQDFCLLCLQPDAKKAEWLGNKMLHLAIRIPGKVKAIKFEAD